MFDFKSFQILEATALDKKALQKPNSNTGEPRIDILRRIIKDQKPLELKKGGTFVVGDIDDALQKLKQFETQPSNISFVSTDGTMVPLSQMAKSKVFGGGSGGAGGGTANTKLTESHQCVMLQAMMDNGLQEESYFDTDIMKAAFKKVKVDESEKNILALEGDWFTSSYNIAKLLIKEGYVHKNHVFHRGSKEMIEIYKLKTKAFKNMGFSPLKDDKWNPGDIWAIDKSFNIEKELPAETVNGLNQALIKHFNDKRLVGISLKGPEKKYPPPMKEFNNQYPPDAKVFKYKGVLLQAATRGDFWSSKSATIKFDGGEMTLKDNSPGDTVKAEIKGKNARGGGLSWGPMSDFINRETRKKVPKFSKGILSKAKKIEKGDPRTTKFFWSLYNYFYKNDTYEDFIENLKKKDKFWISAKLGAIYICYMIDKVGGKKADAIVTHFVNYAGSRSTDASVYVKVGK